MKKKQLHKKRVFFDWKYFPTENRRAYAWACILFWSVLMYFFFQRYVVGVGIVTGRSMLPNLRENEYYLVNKYIYHFTPPQRGDIVILRVTTYAEDIYVKRVIGLAGETLQIRRGQVYVNGQPLDEPYVSGKTFPDVGPIRIEEGTYFVLGDNRPDSQDSRQFGAVPLKQIEGKIKPGEWFPFR